VLFQQNTIRRERDGNEGALMICKSA